MIIKIAKYIIVFIGGFMVGYLGFEYRLKPAYSPYKNSDTVIVPIEVESYYTIDSIK